MKKEFFLILFCIFTVASNAFNQDKSDSLLNTYYESEDEVSKILILHDYIKGTYSIPDTAIKYSNRAIELSDAIGLDSLLAKSYGILAIAYYYKGSLNKTRENLNQSLKYYTNIKHHLGMAICYNDLGVVFYDQGDLYESLKLYFQSLKIKEKIGSIGSVAMTLNNVGNVYKDLNKVVKSLSYYNRSIKLKKVMGDLHGEAMTLNNIGLLYHNNAEYSKALGYYTESLAIKRKLGNLHGEAMTLNNIGLTYETQKKYSAAIPYYKKSIEIKNQIDDQYGLAMSYINISTSYWETGDHEKCFNYLFKAENISKDLGANKLLKDCYQRLYEVYEVQNNTNKAYKYYKLFIVTKDSMMSNESVENLQRLQEEYDAETKQLTIHKLTIQNLIKKEELNVAQLARNGAEKKSKNTTIVSLVVGLILSLSLIIYYVYSFKQRLKINLTLKKLLEEKEILFREVHHRVKNNFQVISSLLNLQAGKTEDKEAQEVLNQAKNRIASMALVHENLYKSKNLSQIQMKEYISELTKHLKDSLSAEADFLPVFEIDDVYLNVETAIPLGLIFNELITNSLKHAFKDDVNNVVEIVMRKNKDKIEVKYRDNGIGLPAGFELKKLDSLGLSLVQILVSQIKGELEIRNDKGTSFSFSFNYSTC